MILKSWGIQPSTVFGHSVGEVAAATAAGILDFDTGLEVIHHRSRTQQLTAGQGSMAAVSLSADELQEDIDRVEGKLTIAAMNSPSAVTISGETQALDELLERLESKEVYCQKLRLDFAFHSHFMDSIRDEFLTAMPALQMRRP